MRVTVLGCGGSAGVPMIGGHDGRGDWGECDPCDSRNRRSRSSIVIESDGGQRLLVDTGPDLRAQLLACGIGRINAILFTHAHADHVCGIDEVRVLNRIAGRPLQAYAFGETLDELRQRFEFAFLPWTPPEFYRPALEAFEVVPGDALDVCGLELTIFEQAHGRIRSIGLRVGGFAYSTDMVALDDRAQHTLAGVDTWLVDAFQRSPHSSHAHLDKVIDWARALCIRRTILTHMGPDMDWSWLLRNLPPGVEPAYDGLVLETAG
jgi:phosphoribosyl 1,2-cyclic phosphate phosphodiesterase